MHMVSFEKDAKKVIFFMRNTYSFNIMCLGVDIMKNRKYLIGICAVLFVIAVFLLVNLIGKETERVQTTAAASYDWYFLPRGEGVQPDPTDQAPFYSKYDAYYIGNNEQKIIYLTFDGGYENGYTEKILDVLKEEQVPAAFFVTGHYVTSAPEVVKRMVAEGHLVCNHSQNHKDLSVADRETIQSELEAIEKNFYEITGTEMPKYVRPPEGKFSENLLKCLQELGYKTFFWSFAYKDWINDDQPSKQAAMDKIISRTHNGEIALLHSTSKTNSEILQDVIKKWKEMGYTFGSLDDFVKNNCQ